jgi:hypothetical protein
MPLGWPLPARSFSSPASLERRSPAPTAASAPCKTSDGALKVIDTEAGESCHDDQQLLTWNQHGPIGPTGDIGAQGAPGPAGPAGPQGPAGTALAYGHYNPYSGLKASKSRNIASVIRNGPGSYCVMLAGSLNAKVAVVQLAGTLGGTHAVAFTETQYVTPVRTCDVMVVMQRVDTHANIDRSFDIIVN